LRVSAVSLLCAVLLCTGLPAPRFEAGAALAHTIAQGAATPDPSIVVDSARLARVVRGIISYTKWPEEPAVLEVCLIGTLRHGQGLETALPQTPGRALRLRPVARVDAEAMAGCHAAYIGEISAEEQDKLRLLTQPLLTLREHDPLCRSGSMFCLRFAEKRISFDLNIDAVARSGLRVDPKVLLLGYRADRP